MYRDEVTPKSVYLRRREFMQATFAAAACPSMLWAEHQAPQTPAAAWLVKQVSHKALRTHNTDESLTPRSDATQYNNFYEFGLDKEDPHRYAHQLTTDPWSVDVSGLCDEPGRYALEALISRYQLEERVYRLRRVEAWSMVIPWLGVPLAELLQRFKPKAQAAYVEFVSLHRPSEMPGQRSLFSSIPWPYREGLRMDEAVHPLSFLAVGMYGQVLPNQNGAPLRLVVPWKYGFKSIKSIVSIRFVDQQPQTSWNTIAPDEYGFYANVNPQVDHPRWSQAMERRLPSSLFSPNRIVTRLFNGYDEVAPLYQGMDLTHQY